MRLWYFLVLPALLFSAVAKPFVEAEMLGRLGNHLFIVATASALAWDHGAEAYFPSLRYRSPPQDLNLDHVFFRCNTSDPPRPVAVRWGQPKFTYSEIPFWRDMKIYGFFQSEKFFAHHRHRLLELFAPHPDDLIFIASKYQHLLQHPCSVGVHVRVLQEDPEAGGYIQYGRDYLEKAMGFFPEEAFFFFFSDNMEFVRQNIPDVMRDRVICVEGEAHYIDLFLLSLCKHNIIMNSTFGWWGAWLNQNPYKVVVAPRQWFHPTSHDTRDLLPEEWIRIDAKWGCAENPMGYR